MRLRFTIRDLLWFAVVLALMIGWYMDHARLRPGAGLSSPGLQIRPVQGMNITVPIDAGWITVPRYEFVSRGIQSIDLKLYAVKDQQVIDLGSATVSYLDSRSSDICGSLYAAILSKTNGNESPSQRVLSCGITTDHAVRQTPLNNLAIDSSYRFVSSLERYTLSEIPAGKEEAIWGFYWRSITVPRPKTVDDLLAEPTPFKTWNKDEIIEFAKKNDDSIVMFATVTAK